MITRPLDLASRLRPEPRHFDWLFFVNVGCLGLFFALFGSRFVLAPGVTALPSLAGATATARTTTHLVRINSAQQILAGDGLRDMPGLRDWLEAQAKTVKSPVLLIQASEDVAFDIVARVTSLAAAAGFAVQIAGVEPARAGGVPPGKKK